MPQPTTDLREVYREPPAPRPARGSGELGDWLWLCTFLVVLVGILVLIGYGMLWLGVMDWRSYSDQAGTIVG